jgi:FimV-like protein
LQNPSPAQSQATTLPQPNDSADPFDLEQLEAQIRDEESGVFSRLFTGVLAPGTAGLLAALVLVVLIIVLLLRRRAAQQEQELDEVLGATSEPTVAAHAETADDSDDRDEEAQNLAFGSDLDPADDDADDDVYTTRLKLAEAYIEMGDEEGAIDMLEEVIADGTTEQQKVAEQILARLEENND